jgi:hypothetical protein
MSALHPKADIAERELDVRFVPKADIATCKKDVIPLPATHAEMMALRLGDVVFERRRFTAICDPAAHDRAFC